MVWRDGLTAMWVSNWNLINIWWLLESNKLDLVLFMTTIMLITIMAN